ncbi:cell wall-binding repeat-containing protein [Herbiconiux sp. CPCC 203407]|uniref:Cell wall-binding repeat-containing protein n=1 Tax=Herbiconiux oxytropis TaxID=2970915 RepID=A0AA42BVQ3_9MICO|nr:cell wall-binding repeat-containing protein [Herbiconiux oxytropis]MCS5724763.1 cell wall-binding repeat-containing protein [Herbiconiux oxytropis]
MGTKQVYLRDVANDTTTLVSRVGVVSASADAIRPVVSNDGRYVAYISGADNLGPRGGISQAVIWDRNTGANRVVTISADPVPNQANAPIQELDLSADGSTVVVATRATNLTPVDTRGKTQIYSIDLATGRTTLLSAEKYAPTPVGGNLDSAAPSVADDGRATAFATASDLIAPGINRGHWQVYLHTRGGLSEGVQLISYAVDTNAGVEQDAYAPDVSGDARVVAFVTSARDATSDTTAGTEQVYVRSVDSSRTRLASYSARTGEGADRASGAPVLSRSGDVVVFESEASDLTDAGVPGSVQVYRRDLRNGKLDLLSASLVGDAGDDHAVAPRVSADGTIIAFQSAAANLTDPSAPGVSQVYLRNARRASELVRLSAEDRYGVSARISAVSFAPHVDTAYVASGLAFADALTGSAAAGFERAPVLLVRKDGIPPAIADELRRLKPRRIVILGGESSVNAATELSLKDFAGQVARVSGADRYEVASVLSSLVFKPESSGQGVAYLASGAVFPDALSGSAVAGVQGGPVLLTTKDSVPDLVMAELRRLKPKTIVVLGGRNTVSDAVLAQVRELGADVSRAGGADRYEVSANVSHWLLKSTAGETVYIASGQKFPDALSGAPAAIRDGSPVLLVSSASIPGPVADELARLRPRRIVVLGGEQTISEPVVAALRAYVAK